MDSAKNVSEHPNTGEVKLAMFFGTLDCFLSVHSNAIKNARARARNAYVCLSADIRTCL